MEALRNKFKRTFSEQGGSKSPAEAANSRLRALHQVCLMPRLAHTEENLEHARAAEAS